MDRTDSGFLRDAAAAAVRRENPNPETTKARNAHMEKQTDWSAICQYCKQRITGTLDQARAHRCAEYEASLEAAS